MKFLFDLFPVILFFAMFKWGENNPESAQALAQQYLGILVSGGQATVAQAPILLATALAILATFGQIGWLLLRKRKVENMLWVSLVIITLFGGLTIYFNNETFIKWKPTVLYWCFGAGLAIAQLVFNKNLIRLMMKSQISLPENVWQKLCLAWAGFFAVMGVINIYVAYNFTTAFWVNFKLFGFTALMFVFIIAQSLMLSKHIKDPQ